MCRGNRWTQTRSEQGATGADAENPARSGVPVGNWARSGTGSIMDKTGRTKGLVILFTGDGKGKTTAALGMALRAAGHGMKTCVVQFIKSGAMGYGELGGAGMLRGLLEINPLGKGFTSLGEGEEPAPEDVKLALETLRAAREKILSRNYDMVVLDEFTYMVHYGLLSVEEILSLIDEKPESLHLVITGRKAHPGLIERADLVTEMQEIKHPLRSGIKAQRGVEF